MMPPRLLTLVLAFALVVPVAAAQAQPQSAPASESAEHVLEVRGGRMYLDGRPLPRQNLPNDLDLDGIEMTYTFAGPVTPVLEIDGVVYVLEEEHLKLLAETERADAQVYFMPTAPPTPPSPQRAEGAMSEASEGEYLRQLSERDQGLYDRIQREHDLENETLQIAARVRSTSSPAERARLTQRLREKLDASFELKQAIRAEEIEQAEAQLNELRRLLRERAARKDQIIERRIEELTGGQ